MSDEIKDIKKSIELINARNKRVETDKAWETSIFRKVTIAVLTYFVMTLFMWSIDVNKPYLNAIIPTLGYVLSTLSLGVFKNAWMKSRK
ncbi:MAG: hypothetical protein US52_C0007G0002 [candidate division WS6 bacterium GW2011_GWA2_37_6]|uniref:Uncharacterized protein n=1 Tax=candidate division WS6 bacterium GW2011_GWA2_37_6 TaxID=1619087 RepID=A0A0G0H1Z1_9BACT|nr:MAG: hypothetical protein US52_C0007G0002 [candidate division WS6 bacterium GW2011_GWA2_37_6]